MELKEGPIALVAGLPGSCCNGPEEGAGSHLSRETAHPARGLGTPLPLESAFSPRTGQTNSVFSLSPVSLHFQHNHSALRGALFLLLASLLSFLWPLQMRDFTHSQLVLLD